MKGFFFLNKNVIFNRPFKKSYLKNPSHGWLSVYLSGYYSHMAPSPQYVKASKRLYKLNLVKKNHLRLKPQIQSLPKVWLQIQTLKCGPPLIWVQ